MIMKAGVGNNICMLNGSLTVIASGGMERGYLKSFLKPTASLYAKDGILIIRSFSPTLIFHKESTSFFC